MMNIAINNAALTATVFLSDMSKNMNFLQN